MGQGRSWEGGSGWGVHVSPWLRPVDVWQGPPQCGEVMVLQLNILIKKKTLGPFSCYLHGILWFQTIVCLLHTYYYMFLNFVVASLEQETCV